MENKFLQLLLPQLFEYDFDLNNNLTKLAVLTPNGSNVTNYDYGKDNQPATATFSNGKKLTYTYDTLGRNNKITIDTDTPITTNYTYWALESGGSTYRSNLLHTEKSEDFKYRYTYDSRNNITLIEEGKLNSSNTLVYTAIESYTYDALDQITQVDYLTQNKRVKYTYDRSGNITREKIYNVSDDTETLTKSNSYTYGDTSWGDKLTKYCTQPITYDAIGNPLTYRDGFTFSWTNGRQLKSLTKGDVEAEYTYDGTGLRLTKTVDDVEHTYLYEGGMLIQETRGNEIFDFSYDAEGNLCMLSYRATADATPTYYYYALNSRNDVIGLYDSDGDLVAKYSYDIWGNVLSVTNGIVNDDTGKETEIESDTHIAILQPFRYRSYYLDSESGLYYLQSRYYDPVTHRFINADSVVSGSGDSVQGYNLFAYCNNNPVNHSDSEGNWPKWAKKLAVAVAVVAVVAVVAAVTVATAGAGSAIAAIAVGAAKGAAIGFAVGAATGAAGGAISHRVTTGSWKGAGNAALNGMADGALSGAITGAISGGTTGGLNYGTFSSKSSLVAHFTKHGDEFGDMYTNAKQYARGAKYVIKNGTYIPEKNAYIRFLGVQGKGNYAFVGMKNGGRISTYHVRSVSKMVKDGISLFS